MLIKKVPFGKVDREKCNSFVDQVAKATKWVPGAKYEYNREILKNVPIRNGKFLKRARHTITDELFIKGKKKEKTSPSPSAYKSDS